MKVRGRLVQKSGYWHIVITYWDEYGVRNVKWFSTKIAVCENREKELEQMLLYKKLHFEEEYIESKKNTLSKQEVALINKCRIMYFDNYIKMYTQLHREKWSPITAKVYSESYTKEIANYFKRLKIRLCELNTNDIVGFYNYLRGKGLKISSVKHYSNLINGSLKYAKGNGIIINNPHDEVPSMKREKTKIDFYNQQELLQLLEVIKGSQYELALKVAIYYGLRRSEIIGIRWSAIDFVNKTLSINHKVLKVNGQFYLEDKLKTEKSNRTLPLFENIELDLLRHQKKIERDKYFYYDEYNDKYADYVFVNDKGELLNPDTLTHEFKKIIRENNMREIRFHDLRHSCASLMIAKKVPMINVMDWLGHANFLTTADIYTHLEYASKIDSAESIRFALCSSESIQPILCANNS